MIPYDAPSPSPETVALRRMNSELEVSATLGFWLSFEHREKHRVQLLLCCL
ncbi:hypothetical protein Hanom_Chr01g00009791 [Helianthus anomalus]